MFTRVIHFCASQLRSELYAVICAQFDCVAKIRKLTPKAIFDFPPSDLAGFVCAWIYPTP